MKMSFDWDKVDGLSKALGGRVDLIEKLINVDGLSPDMIELIKNSKFRKDFIHLYGFHIDSNESDPMEAVTYLEDAVGMAPAHMNYASGKFDYGDWENAFFMPKPCMLKYDGTVDYYLDPNDYGKKEDGTASDVADFAYGGNAMMEWGRDGKKIWYKIVPDEDDNTSASIYFSDQKLDDGFHAWSFINNQGDLVDHFYTPIYNGTLDTDGKLRSISRKDYTYICQNKTAIEEIEAAELNNPDEDKLWYIEVYADITLINLLLVLMGKCLDTQLVFGNGATNRGNNVSLMLGTGTLDNKGLFFGYNNNYSGVKVFGMENYWGNRFHRVSGLISVNGFIKYKMTRGTEDGSIASDYNTTGENYLDSDLGYMVNFGGCIMKHTFSEDGSMFFSDFRSDNNKSYTDYGYISTGTNYATYGGSCNSGVYCGAFNAYLSGTASSTHWSVGASPSCKPLS